jgi:hypothetical protein
MPGRGARRAAVEAAGEPIPAVARKIIYTAAVD